MAIGAGALKVGSQILGVLGSAKSRKKAKKKARRKAKKQRAAQEAALLAAGMNPSAAKSVAAAAQPTASNPRGGQRFLSDMFSGDSTSGEENFFMKDYLGLGFPTIPVGLGIAAIATKGFGMFGSKGGYRRRKRRRR